MNLTDNNKTFTQMPKTAYHILSSPGKLSVGRIPGHQIRFNKYEKIETTSCVLSDHTEIKLGINTKKSIRKDRLSQRLNNTY